MDIPSVEIFTIVGDEQRFIIFFHNFYTSRLSNVTFSICDMGSVDKTVEIAKDIGMKVLSSFEEKFSDRTNMEYKSNCWKTSNADFVIIQDLDEMLDVTDDFLLNNNFSCVRAEAWDMIGEGQEISKISKAVRIPNYDKYMTFRVRHFSKLTFSPYNRRDFNLMPRTRSRRSVSHLEKVLRARRA